MNRSVEQRLTAAGRSRRQHLGRLVAGSALATLPWLTGQAGEARAAGAAGATGAARAAETVGAAGGAGAPAWPSALTRFIVPFPPGGPMDLLARVIADALVSQGRSVVVDNLAGGAGNIGIQQAMRAPGDGSVLLFVPQGNITINATLFPKLPFDWSRDFKPVTLLASTPNLLVVGPSVPATSVQALIDYGKAHPGKLTYASPGIGSSLHLIGELFRRQAGIDVVHVPYKGTTPAMQDVAGGQVDLMFGALPTLQPYVSGGKLRALAVTTASRAEAMPALPTLAEAGVAGIDVPSWYGVMVPSATPDRLVEQIQQTIATVMALPAVRQRLEPQGLATVTNAPAEFASQIRKETAQWAEVIRVGGIKAED